MKCTLGSPFFSVPTLKRRGWTDSMVSRILGEPDALTPNWRHPTSVPPTRLYNPDRVFSAEATDEFKALSAKAMASRETRRAASQRVFEAKEKQSIDWVESLTVDLKRSESVVEEAVAWRNDKLRRYFESLEKEFGVEGDGFQPEPPPKDAYDLARLVLRYAEDQFSGYKDQLDREFGKRATAEAHHRLRRKITNAVQAAYPEYASLFPYYGR